MRKRRDQGEGSEAAAPGAASRAFLQLSEGNEVAATGPSTARKVVAVAIAALYLLSVPLLWSSTADAHKAVRPASSGAEEPGADNSGPSGSGDDDDDHGANAVNTAGTSRAAQDTAGTTGGEDSTRGTAGTSRGGDTAGTTAGHDSTRG